MIKIIITAGLALGLFSSVATASDPVPTEQRRHLGFCGDVERFAGCRTLLHPDDGIVCVCPWDGLTSVPAPCAPGEGDCSE